MRIWTIDEHRYGLITHQRHCWGLRGVRPHAPYRTKYEWGYVPSALEIEGRDEAHVVFRDLAQMEAGIETERRPLWTEPSRVRPLVGAGWIRTQVNACSG